MVLALLCSLSSIPLFFMFEIHSAVRSFCAVRSSLQATAILLL